TVWWAWSSFVGLSAIEIVGVARVPTMRAVRIMLRMGSPEVGAGESAGRSLCSRCAAGVVEIQPLGLARSEAIRLRGANGHGHADAVNSDSASCVPRDR